MDVIISMWVELQKLFHTVAERHSAMELIHFPPRKQQQLQQPSWALAEQMAAQEKRRR